MIAAGAVAWRLYGMTPEQAWRDFVCIRCKASMYGAVLPALDAREYLISAMCPSCFDNIMSDLERWDELEGVPV